MASTGKVRNRKKGWVTALIFLVLIILAFVVFLIIRANNNRLALQNLASLDTVAYTKGSLTASISGTGTVRANQTATLTWSTSGTVGEIGVALGDQINTNDTLMTLDENSIPIDILQAQVDVINVQQALTSLYASAPLELAQAKLDLITAEKNLEDLASDREILNYQRCTDTRLEDLQTKYDNAQSLYDRFPSAQTKLSMETALANLNYCQKDYTEQERAQAEARIVVAEEKITSLNRKIETLKDGPDPDEVTKLETQLQIALARLDKKSVKASFSSTVTAIYNKPGDLVVAGTKAIQLADLSTLFVDVQISEVDISLIKIGQSAALVFDAFYTETFQGKVTEISPIGTESQGVVSYTVTIQVLNGMDSIKPGMTAAISIITEEKNDVFIIPIDALTTMEGVDTVYVMRNNVPVAVEVTVGVFSNDEIEILSADIAEGELIVINPPTSVLGRFSDGNLPGFMGGR
jgi:HlyD family secretion protein